MARKKVARRQVHFTISMEDEKSLAWLDAQSNKSFSLCQLMQRAYDRRGAIDMQATSTDEPRRRRTAAEMAEDREDELLRERAMGYDDDGYDEPAYAEPEASVRQMPQPAPRQQMPAPEGRQTHVTGAKRNRMLSGALADFTQGNGTQNSNIDDIRAMMGR